MSQRPFTLFLISIALSGVASAGSLVGEVRGWRRNHEREIVAEFFKMLSLPNVASDVANISRNADAIAALFRQRGLDVRVLRLENAPPVVFATLDNPGARRTVTFYAHYDGQPTDPAEWVSAPWTPVLRSGRIEDGAREVEQGEQHLDPDWRIYARSAGDDKAPIIGFVAALDALRALGRRPRVNLRFFFEGEEEAGSPHLDAYLRQFPETRATDLWILCDGPIHQSGRKEIFFGARGTTDAEITVYGPNRGLHSGHYGNWAPNPISEMAHLIDSMRDENGTILISHYGDSVRSLGEEERRALAEVPSVDDELKRAFGLGRTESPGTSLVDAIQRPAINLRGIASGHVGSLASNTISPTATLSIDFRLVPDQTPGEVRRLVEAHIAAQGYFVVSEDPDLTTRLSHPKIAKVTWGKGYAAWRTPMDLAVPGEVARLVAEAAGEPIVRMPMLGGSIPMCVFAGAEKTPVVGVPIANYDDNQHAPNENLRLGNLWDGIEIYATLFAELGPLRRGGSGAAP